MTFSLELSYLKVIDVCHPCRAICAAQEMLVGMSFGSLVMTLSSALAFLALQ